MWKLKACPKCKGDMLVEVELDGRGQCGLCVQCGYRLDIRNLVELGRLPGNMQKVMAEFR